MATVDDLFSFISASPSPYHAVETALARLAESGFTRLGASAPWPDGPGRYVVARGGALVAWVVPAGSSGDAAAPFRILGAHTDSPNLRLKPRPDTGGSGWKQLGVEVYGGALWNSWLDRDLGLSGRVTVGDGTGEALLVMLDEPLCRIPQLAVHLDRDVNSKGLTLNPQQHLTPVWGVGAAESGEFARFLADVVNDQHGLDIGAEDIGGWDLMLHDTAPPTLLGRRRELIASARLDNLVSCWASIEALLPAADQPSSDQRRSDGAGGGDDSPVAPVMVTCLYDHEEVGSTSATGADGSFLGQVLERSVLARAGSRDHYLRALADSICLSADMAHATHPNYPDRHDPAHPIRVNGGPVIKVNANQRYATEANTAAAVGRACERASVPHQWFVSRNDSPCGSTIGPVTAAHLGVPTVDVGIAQLSMHSARELCGAEDPPRLVDAMTAFLAPVWASHADSGKDGPEGSAPPSAGPPGA